MTLKEKQNIDRLLNSYFREEARKIEIPDSRRCWQDFQQLLEKSRQDGFCMEDTISAAVPQKKGSLYHFMRRYRSLTALAAACVLGIMLLSGMPPAQSLRQALTGMLPEVGQDNMKMAGTEDEKAEGQMLELQSIPAEPEGRSGVQDEAQGTESFRMMQTQESTESAPLHPAPEKEDELLRQKLAPPGAGEMGLLLHPDAVLEEARELTFNTINAYRSALQEHKGLVRGKIFLLAVPPEGYSFSGAFIYKTDSSLYSVRQEFSSRSGDKLILQQDFFQAVATPAAEREEDPGAAVEELEIFNAAKQTTTYGYGTPGYQLSIQNGRNTMQWFLEDSAIMITAGLDEHGLLVVSEQLVALEQ